MAETCHPQPRDTRPCPRDLGPSSAAPSLRQAFLRLPQGHPCRSACVLRGLRGPRGPQSTCYPVCVVLAWAWIAVNTRYFPRACSGMAGRPPPACQHWCRRAGVSLGCSTSRAREVAADGRVSHSGDLAGPQPRCHLGSELAGASPVCCLSCAGLALCSVRPRTPKRALFISKS